MGKSSNAGLGILAIISFIGIVFVSIATLVISTLKILAMPLLITVIVVGALLLIHLTYVNVYFTSKGFLGIKNSIKEYIDNCNDLNHHINELKNSFIDVKYHDYGNSELSDSSNYNFKRKEWANSVKNHQVYNCSATVCKNASNQPFKYLCKYFNIDMNEGTLSEFESIFNDFSAAEQGKVLFKKERETIIENIKASIPWIIFQFSNKRLLRELGFEDFRFDDFYFPVYTFQYISAGGNSSTKCDVELDVNNLERFIFYLNDLVKFRKSVAGQRALMTQALREKIKTRDNFTCQNCSLSIYDERNLLLEIDHITPLSKGGMTAEDNLQVLCWRCNRSKGSKIEDFEIN